MSEAIEIKVTPLYVSCTGMLCITMTIPKIGCLCFEVIGVNEYEEIILREIK